MAEPITAENPFDNADADVILRTSDNVNYHFFRLILSLASPIFKDMFTVPQPTSINGGTANAKPSVDVSEDSETLGALLRFLHPGVLMPLFPSLEIAGNVVSAAEKYEMTAVTKNIEQHVITKFAETHPFQVYFLSWRFQWEMGARVAARNSLELAPLGQPKQLTLTHELDHVSTGIAYHKLVEYHFQCGRALLSTLNEGTTSYLSWVKLLDRGHISGCPSCKTGPQYAIWNPNQWFTQYIKNIRGELLEWPCKVPFDKISLVPEIKCGSCSPNAAIGLDNARIQLRKVMEESLMKVELQFRS